MYLEQRTTLKNVIKSYDTILFRNKLKDRTGGILLKISYDSLSLKDKNESDSIFKGNRYG